MNSTLQRAPTDLWDKWDSGSVTDLRPHPIPSNDDAPPRRQRTLGRRASRAFLRFLITLGIGVGGTLAWQAYGDDARQMMATAYPQQLGWIAPQAAPTAADTPSASTPLAAAAPAAPPVDRQQLSALSLNMAAVRQSLEQLATQVASSQQQMSGEIAKLQASEQDILNKIATLPPRPAAVAPRKPVPPPQQPTALAPPPTLVPQPR
jgi:hypothetical protein